MLADVRADQKYDPTIPIEIFPPKVYRANTEPPSSSPGALLLSCLSCPLLVELAKMRAEKGYWHAMHQKAVAREAILKEELAQLQAKLRLRERQLFGRKSEKGKAHNEKGSSPTDTSKRPRGQQPGSTGHGRRDFSHLPAEEEQIELPADKRCCPHCRLPFKDYPHTEDSEVLEITVNAHRRIIRRKRYRRACTCEGLPRIITAPPPPKLIAKGILGISVWVTVLLDKFLFLRPTHRLLADLKTHGLDLTAGTLTDGLQTLMPFFTPIYKAIADKNRSEDRWHADETRWLVFIEVAGKLGNKWYMWVFISKSAVVYTLDPSRSAKAPRDHFEGTAKGILVVDRYSAYKAMAKLIGITLAFCWAHVRRDFLGVAKDWPQLESWAMEWVADIGKFYHLNHLRLDVMEQPEAFAQKDRDLREAVKKMDEKREAQLKEKELHTAKKKTLQSLKEHWQGLTVFVDYPEVPMDNNKAERHERTPVIARNNFYGSFALWAGTLAAMMFSIFKTLEIWHINPRVWLTAFLEACAANQGLPPVDIQGFLPWNMTQEQLKAFSSASKTNDSS